jgi:hypothetical protein
MGSRWIFVCTVPVCLASLCSSTVGEGGTQRGASQSASCGSAGAAATVQADVAIFSEVKLEPGEEETFRFVAPEVPEGRDAVLTLSARLDTPKVAGHTSALRLVLNGTPVGGDRLLNRPLRVQARGGQVYSMAAGDSLTTYYSPDFESPDDHPHYGLTGGVKACRFKLRVSDLTSGHLAVMQEHDVVLGNRLAGLWLAGLERPLGDRSASETSLLARQDMARNTVQSEMAPNKSSESGRGYPVPHRGLGRGFLRQISM